MKESPDRPLIAGTRGSALARWQTEFVIAALHNLAPSVQVELHVISTVGDRDKTSPLAELGALGVFTTELENALREDEIDFAVHSLKDLPTDLANDLPIAAILERAEPRDVLVSRHGVGLSELAQGARIGTSSARRAAQLLALRPDLQIVPLRGNVDTRLRKAASEDYDAVVLAAAGVLRLGRGDAITEYLLIEEMLPDPGQGALAVQVRVDDFKTLALVSQLDHTPTRQAVTAERAFLQALGGGCRMPMAAYARVEDNLLHLRGMVASTDGKRLVRRELLGMPENAQSLGIALAQEILNNGGAEILDMPLPADTNKLALGNKRIVITRAETQAAEFAEKIRAHGGEPVFFPTIAFAPLDDFQQLDSNLARPETFDWVVFTSANGVRAVAERLRILGMDMAALADTRVAAIGTGTAHALMQENIRVDFIPTKFLGEQIARELPVTADTRALLLRADLASQELADGLTARGVAVTDIDAYRTIPAAPSPLDWRGVDAVTFTSASTVKHCWQLLDDTSRAHLTTRDIFCIGPVTASAARELNLPVTAVASTHTLDGLLDAMIQFYERNAHAA